MLDKTKFISFVWITSSLHVSRLFMCIKLLLNAMI